ncbi:MAG: DUF4340 domain-containing protein [Alphaproteobacteria bacterium]|nr:DUF4340 domain-containing protein [Alphaproteobacteria bacterium]
MSRQVTILSVALVLSLGASYLRWTAEEGTDAADTIVVLDAKAGEIEELRWDSDKLDMVLLPQSDARGDWLLVKTTEEKERPVAEPEAPQPDDEGEAAEEEPEDESPDDESAEEEDDLPEPPAPAQMETFTEVVEFKAGEAGDKLLESLSPMVAKRALDTVADDKLDELGLAEPEATLVVKRAGKGERTFQVGGEAYGTRDRYLRDAESGKVYLIEDDLLRPLKYGKTRLPDRELIGIETADIATVAITAPGGAVSFEQRNPDDPKAAYWAPPGGESDESAGNWMNKLLKLRSASFVQAEDTPTALSEALTIQVTGDDGVKTTLKLLEGTDPEGREAFYAESDFTRRQVKLHNAQAQDLIQDVETILDVPEEE